MLLSATFLQDVGGVNNWDVTTQASFTQGDATAIYFQLIDASVFKTSEGYMPMGRRYMPASGATLTVIFGNLDDSKKVTRVATQPFAQDPSIWVVNVLSSDPIVSGTADFRLSLNESGNIKTGYLCAGIRIY